MISVNAKGPAGEELISTNPNWAWFFEDGFWQDPPESSDYFKSRAVASYFQEVYVVNGASTLDPVGLGTYAEIMHGEAVKEVDVKKHYLKAANRAFSYVRSIGNAEAMEAFKPVFQSKYLEMNQRNAMLEAINLALSGKCSTRLLTAAKTREMLYIAARDLEPLAGGLYSTQLRGLADQVRGTGPTGDSPLMADAGQSALLEELNGRIAGALNAGVASIVLPAVEKYVRPY